MRRLAALFVLMVCRHGYATEVDDPFLFETPDHLVSTIASAQHALRYFDADDRRFIRFFVVRDKREANVLSFVVHSLTGVGGQNRGIAFPPQPVGGSLYWIDIRNYNWTERAFEAVAQFEPYIAPFSNELVLRADWFIVNTMDVTRQSDLGIAPFYEVLLYANFKAPPANVQEFDRIWSRNLNVIGGVLNLESKAVSLHNRFLFRLPNGRGYRYDTYDALSDVGNGDYLNNLFTQVDQRPIFSDAGEIFLTNDVGLPIYTLRDKEGKIVNFGDPSAVRHIGDCLGDVRVRYPHSCIDCHSNGPLRSKNHFADLAKVGDILAPDREILQEFVRVFLSQEFERSIDPDQQYYAASMKRVNGLTPVENRNAYIEIVKAYSRPLDLKTAANELAITPEMLVAAVNNFQSDHRLVMLVATQVPIPRQTWEFDTYQDALKTIQGGQNANNLRSIHGRTSDGYRLRR